MPRFPTSYQVTLARLRPREMIKFISPDSLPIFVLEYLNHIRSATILQTLHLQLILRYARHQITCPSFRMILFKNNDSIFCGLLLFTCQFPYFFHPCSLYQQRPIAHKLVYFLPTTHILLQSFATTQLYVTPSSFFLTLSHSRTGEQNRI